MHLISTDDDEQIDLSKNAVEIVVFIYDTAKTNSDQLHCLVYSIFWKPDYN